MKGFCELNLGKWAEAAWSFESCYKKYPSRLTDRNPYHLEALIHWAEAEWGRGDPHMATRLERKYLCDSDGLVGGY